MTTTAGHSFYIGPIGSFYSQVNDTGSWLFLLYINDITDNLGNLARLFADNISLSYPGKNFDFM
jgi:hypothetical protein